VFHRLGPRGLLAALVAVLILVAACCATLVVVVAPRASAQVLGPGTPTIPGFSGYVLADNGELGIGRLPNGTYGVCTDTGGEFAWPADPTRTLITNPRTAYALGKYVEPARSDGRLAAALWWAVGADFGQNSHAERVLSHVAQLKAENPSVWSDVRQLHDRIVADAIANAAPPDGYRLSIKVREGVVERVGIKGGGDWIDGYPITLRITGPARFEAGDAKTWSGTTADRERSVRWTRTGNGNGRVVVKATVDQLPARDYERWWSGRGTQRVLAAANRVTATDVDAIGPGQETVPLQVVKAAQDGDRSGLVGVTIEVHADSPTGPVTGAHTFTDADLQASGVVATTFSPSPPGCRNDCLYDPGRSYYVVITGEPPGWTPVATEVLARLNDDASALVARLDDLRIFTPSLVTQISAQQSLVGDTIRDTVTASNTGGYAIPGHWALLGPVQPVAAPGEPFGCATVDWSGAAQVATGDFLIAGDGDYVVGEHLVTTPGCYTYVESADATPQTLAVAQTSPGIPAETTLTTHQPALATQVSATWVEVGATLTDTVAVSGTGGATVPGGWRLLGPVAATAERSCQGLDWTQAPVAGEGSFTASGDGSYVVGETVVAAPGCYTYVERLEATATTSEASWTPAGHVTETALATHTPGLATRVNRQRAVVGDRIRDAVAVSGTGGATLLGTWRLLGPVVPAQSDGRPTCRGLTWIDAPVAGQGAFPVNGDGTYLVGEHRVRVAGCYTYVEGLPATATTEAVPETRPGLRSETALAAGPTPPAAAQHETRPTPGPAAVPTVPMGPLVDAGGGAAGHGDRALLLLAALTFVGAATASAAALLRRGRRGGS